MSNSFRLVLLIVFELIQCQPFEITGFGWHLPQLVFHSRYFFVWDQLVDSVVITSPDTGCRVWHQLFNETDFEDRNLTIIRYKLLSEVCLGGLQIRLFGDGNRLLATKVVDEDIWSERCVCRREDWSRLMKCHQMRQQFPQIDSDLRFLGSE